jgi:tetratricopeptide (TPR) repeat protein
MKILTIALLLSLLAGTPAEACLNSYGTTLEGEEIEIIATSLEDAVSSYMARLKSDESMREKLVADSTKLATALIEDKSHRVRTDYAVSLIKLGHFSEAVAILRDVEAKHPGKYITATNLGTAYELLGRNDSALYWISEGYRRNPGSHHGSEWLHVRIIEAKLAMERDPNWLRTHTVLGLDFGNDSVPRAPQPAGVRQALTRDSLRSIGEALLYQLSERLRMVKPPDPIAADLLTDLGNVLALTSAVQIAAPVYELALEYEPVRADLVRARIDAIEEIVDEHPPHEEGEEARNILLALAGGVAVFVVGGAWLVRRDLRRRRSA